MLLILALFALQVGEPLLVTDEIVTIPASQIRSVELALHQRPAVVECTFHVAGDHPGVRAILMSSTDADRFRHEKAHTVLAATGYQQEGDLKVAVSNLGDYEIVLDNRLEGRRTAQVRLKISLLFQPEPAVVVRYPDKSRQALAIGGSFLLFAGIAAFAGRKIHAAINRQRIQPPQPPLF
jgi:hypothetical protein